MTLPRRAKRMIGGLQPQGGNYSFMASYAYDGEHQCGATIINEDIVLTAAHCVQAAWIMKMTIRVGSQRSDYGGAVYKIERISYPADYQHLEISDIALLKVKGSIKLGDGVSSISFFDSNDELAHETEGLTLGWGYTGDPRKPESLRLSPLLLQLTTTIYSEEYCCNFKLSCRENTFCSSASIDSTICSGDSGGPLIVSRGGIWRQAGIVFTGRCHHPTAPQNMIWTKVSAYAKWIKDESEALLTPKRLPYVPRTMPPAMKEEFRKNKGIPISPRNAPWAIAIKTQNRQEFRCSGAVIHSWYILTIASCVDTEEDYIVVSGTDSPTGHQAYFVQKIIPHGEFTVIAGDITVNDIALLRVQEDLPYNEFLGPINMTQKDDEFWHSNADVYFWEDHFNSQGVHDTHTLYSVPIEMKEHVDECSGIYKQSGLSPLSKNQICGINDYGMCMDLQGAPIVTEDGDERSLLGLFIRKTHCEDPQFPNVITEVASYQNWIKDCIGGRIEYCR